MNVLITGGAGFVGSSLAIYLKKKYPAYEIACLDNLKRRGSELSIGRLKEHDVKFFHGDIRNKEDFDQLSGADVVIDASAEPSVLAGIAGGTDYVINTNLLGTINCLNFAVKNKSAFIFLSTSRIYPIARLNEIKYHEEPTHFAISADQHLQGISQKGVTEVFPMDGSRSFYGASKYASELFIQEYSQFFNLKSIVNRCGVIAGPWQMGKLDQGVTVLWVAKHFWKQPISYIGYNGSGKQVRDLLHIDDLSRLVDHQIRNLDKLNGSTFNVGGGAGISTSLVELTALCREIVGNDIPVKAIVEGRPADIPIYITDNTLIEKATGWRPEKTTRQVVTDIYDWIRQNDRILAPILK